MGKALYTSDLSIGMITSENIYNDAGLLIVPKDTELTEKIITKLRFYNVYRVKIKDNVDNTKVPEITSTYASKIKASKEFKVFEKNFIDKTEDLKSDLTNIVEKNENIDTVDLLLNVKDIIGGIKTNGELFDFLNNMSKIDDATYSHCLNVSLLCNVFGKWLDWSNHDIEQLTIAGMLHDIGKLMIPNSILNKPGKLTKEEFDIAKSHTFQGFKILEHQPIDERIKRAALLHHERNDGTGYPLSIKGNSIDDFAKIIAIADVYDAMTSTRAYRQKVCPFEVIRLFEYEGIKKYDAFYIMTFLEKIAQTYLNSWVRLSTDEEGEVVFINKHHLSKPIVKVGSAMIDLSREDDIYITDII